MYSSILSCTLMSTHVLSCLLMYSSILSCLLQCTPVYSHVLSCLLLSTPVYSSVLSCTPVYSHVLQCTLMSNPCRECLGHTPQWNPNSLLSVRLGNTLRASDRRGRRLMSGQPLMRAHSRYRPAFLIQVSSRRWDERDRIERRSESSRRRLG